MTFYSNITGWYTLNTANWVSKQFNERCCMCWPLLACKFYLKFCKFYLKNEINNITNSNSIDHKNESKANHKWKKEKGFEVKWFESLLALQS